MFEEEIFPLLKKLANAAAVIFVISATGGFLVGRFALPYHPVPETLSAQQVIPPDSLPPGQPPLPVVAAPDAVLSYGLGDLWPYTSAQERAALHEMLAPLQSWARDHWPPSPDATPVCP